MFCSPQHNDLHHSGDSVCRYSGTTVCLIQTYYPQLHARFGSSCFSLSFSNPLSADLQHVRGTPFLPIMSSLSLFLVIKHLCVASLLSPPISQHIQLSLLSLTDHDQSAPSSSLESPSTAVFKTTAVSRSLSLLATGGGSLPFLPPCDGGPPTRMAGEGRQGEGKKGKDWVQCVSSIPVLV